MLYFFLLWDAPRSPSVLIGSGGLLCAGRADVNRAWRTSAAGSNIPILLHPKLSVKITWSMHDRFNSHHLFSHWIKAGWSFTSSRPFFPVHKCKYYSFCLTLISVSPFCLMLRLNNSFIVSYKLCWGLRAEIHLSGFSAWKSSSSHSPRLSQALVSIPLLDIFTFLWWTHAWTHLRGRPSWQTAGLLQETFCNNKKNTSVL